MMGNLRKNFKSIEALLIFLAALVLSPLSFCSPVISGVYVSSSTSTTATIVWTTSDASTSQIYYGYSSSSLPYSNNVDRSMVTSHSMTLTILNSKQPYYFYVVSGDSNGSSISSTYEFALCGTAQVPIGGTINSAYGNGSYTITWNPPSGSSGTPTACGSSIETSISGSIDQSGAFSAVVYDSFKVTPGPGSWTVSAQDPGNLAPISTTVQFSPVTVDVSSELQDAASPQTLVGVIANQTDETVYPAFLGMNTIYSGATSNAIPKVSSTSPFRFTNSSLSDDGTYIYATEPIHNLTVNGSFTATGLVTNSDLANDSITISGTSCTLGGTCSPYNGTTGQIAWFSSSTMISGSTVNGIVYSDGVNAPTAATSSEIVGIISGDVVIKDPTGTQSIYQPSGTQFAVYGSTYFGSSADNQSMTIGGEQQVLFTNDYSSGPPVVFDVTASTCVNWLGSAFNCGVQFNTNIAVNASETINGDLNMTGQLTTEGLFYLLGYESSTGYLNVGSNGLVSSSSTIPNSGLTNSSITVNGTTCTLGGSCSPAASSIVSGTTTVSGGTSGNVLYDNAGVLDTLSPSITVNGSTCTLGGSCSPSASSSSVTVGTTTVGSGTSGYVLYDNAGILGNLSPSILVNSVSCSLGDSCAITAAASNVAIGTTTVSGGTTGNVLYNNGGTLGGLSSSMTIQGVLCSLGGTCSLDSGMTISKTDNGYFQLPTWLGGMVVQWGTVTGVGTSSVSESFNMTFPTACLGILATDNGSTSNTGHSIGAWPDSTSPTTTFHLIASNTSTQVFWVAIGY